MGPYKVSWYDQDINIWEIQMCSQFEEMRAAGISPTARTYHALVHAMVAANDLHGGAFIPPVQKDY